MTSFVYTSIGNEFTCAHCIALTSCNNGLQTEFFLLVNINHQIIDRKRCSLYRNGYELVCDIGNSQCLVDMINSSDQYVVRCPIDGYNVDMISATENFNATQPGCSGELLYHFCRIDSHEMRNPHAYYIHI